MQLVSPQRRDFGGLFSVQALEALCVFMRRTRLRWSLEQTLEVCAHNCYTTIDALMMMINEPVVVTTLVRGLPLSNSMINSCC